MNYKVWVEPEALDDARATPGNVRQRIKRVFKSFETDPRPASSKKLDVFAENCEPRRLKLENWRIIYAVHDAEQWVWVLAVRKRPPYNYDDLTDLLSRIN